MRFIAAVPLLASLWLHGQTYFYISHISISPPAPTTQDEVSIHLHGDLSSTGSYIVSANAIVTGQSVLLNVIAASDGGLTVLVPHTETIAVGQLAAGTYTITVQGFGVADFAPPPEHVFTVSGGGDPCSELTIASIGWAAFTDTALVVHVFNASSTLFDYPNFVLLSASGDTLAVEPVTFFGIADESLHLLAVEDGTTMPPGAFQAQLHLWTNFTTIPACTWDLVVDLCPPPPCDTIIPYIQNLGGAIPIGTFNWWITQGSNVVANGAFQMDLGQEYDADTLCLPPGAYTMWVQPLQDPTGGAPFFGATAPDNFSSPLTLVSWNTPAQQALDFYLPCVNGGMSITQPSEGAPWVVAEGGTLSLVDGSGRKLGRVMVHDAMGRLVHSSTHATDRLTISTDGWAGGVYVVSAGDGPTPLIHRRVLVHH